MQVTLYHNVFMSLYIDVAAWIASRWVGKEPLVVFPNRYIVCGHAGKLGTQSISKSYKWKPWTLFCVCEFDNIFLFIFEVKEQLASLIAG